MTTSSSQLREGCVVIGSLFNEPMRVETVRVGGDGTWTEGLVGTQSERFRKVTLTDTDISTLTILDSAFSYDGDGRLLRLGLQAYSLGIAYEFDPYFGLSISRVDPLPHKGDPDNFTLFLQLLDADAYADVRSIREAMSRRRAPFYLRRTKEAMVYFPIFNFVATNTIEGRVLQRLLEKLQEIRDALDDDAVFNVVGEVLPAAHVERVLRDYYAGKLGDADLEERLLKDVDEGQFRAICQNAFEGLASKKLNLEMPVERRARAQERRVVPETIARFIREAAEYVPLKLKIVDSLPHAFEPARTPSVLRRYERDPDWKLPMLANKYPRCSADRDTAEKNNLEWVTPGHPLFEAVRRHTLHSAREPFSKGACFYPLQHEEPARLDFYRARVVDGLGYVVHERLFAVEIGTHRRDAEGAEKENEKKNSLRTPRLSGEYRLVEPAMLGDFTPAKAPEPLPDVVHEPEPTEWLHENALKAFIEETRAERLAEVERIAEHVELSLTELLQRADEEIGKASIEKEKGVPGADGRLAQAENRHAELLARRERRRSELERQRSLSLQAVERIASVLILPHPEREAPDVRRMRPSLETEDTAMRVVMEYEQAQGRQVYDVHEKNLGYDITSLDLDSGELRLIEVKGLAAATGTILLTPNEQRVAEDRRDCYWLYIVTNCATKPTLQEPVKDPARLEWHEVTKVAHYYLSVNAIRKPMQVRDNEAPYGEKDQE